jgi:hypothetical protein
LGLALLAVLAVFAFTFFATVIRDPRGIGCGLQTGTDYLLFHASSRMIFLGRGPDLYSREGLREIHEEIFSEPLSKCARTDFPVAYPPVFLLPYVPLSFLPPLLGFLVATAASVTVFGFALWGSFRFSLVSIMDRCMP